MGNFVQDVRYALRQLRKSYAFSLTAVITLAFGIGATTAIFSIVEGVLLRPLPFTDPAQLVALGDKLEGVQYGSDVPGVTAPGIRIYMRDTHAFSNLGGYRAITYEFSGFTAQNPDQINAARVTSSIFPTLGELKRWDKGANQRPHAEDAHVADRLEKCQLPRHAHHSVNSP